MNISTYLKLQKETVPTITKEDLPSDPESVLTVRFINLPLYGELLGVELLILNTLNNIAKKLNAQVNLVAAKVKKIHKCKAGDVAGGVVESLSTNGIYTALKQGEIAPFKADGLEELIQLMESKPYVSDTLVFEDGDTALRLLAYSMTEELGKVQGGSIEEKVRNLSLKIPFISDYVLESVDINAILGEVPGIYDNYEAYILSRSSDILLRVLLYTRCGIDHDVLFNLRLSETEKLLSAAQSEIPAVKSPKPNSAKAKPTEVSEEDDSKSGDQSPGDREADAEGVSDKK